MFPALAVFAIHPQSSGIFLSVTTWIEQSASNVFYFVLRRLAKELAVFAIHPQSSGMFLSVTTWVEQSASNGFLFCFAAAYKSTCRICKPSAIQRHVFISYDQLSCLLSLFFLLPCGGLQKHLPYLQTIRNPVAYFYQLRPVELFAFFIFSSTLWRLGKLPELLAGFARPPMLSHIYRTAHRCPLYNTCMPYSPHSRAMVYFGHSIPTQRCVFYLPHPQRRSFFILKKLKNFFYVLHYLLES